jgi:hypothetical protein
MDRSDAEASPVWESTIFVRKEKDMRTIKLFAAALVIASVALSPGAAFAGKKAQAGANRPTTATTALTELSPKEIGTLLWMREEEKVARDVYITMNDKWQEKIFARIASSEQKHFDAIGKKLALYGIPDPALPGIGDFFAPELKAMYDTLVAKGSTSYVEALKVGVTIEEEDIKDLEAAIAETNAVPLEITYVHLLNGSENHLASFIKVLERQGVVYE